jgi:hypothetical protein
VRRAGLVVDRGGVPPGSESPVAAANTRPSPIPDDAVGALGKAGATPFSKKGEKKMKAGCQSRIPGIDDASNVLPPI